MGKVVGAISLSLVLASAGAAWSQGIGTVTALPNAVTGEVSADTAVRPGGEKVYIVRDGALVSQATIKSSGGQGGTVLSLPSGAAAAVKVGDQVALTPPSGSSVVTTTKTTKVTTELGAPEPPLAPAAPPPVAVSVPGPVPPPPVLGEGQLDKSAAKYKRTEVTAIMAESTPRGTGVPVFPAPAKVVTEAGIMAPYGQGLAAAAPVGTPYLRSPAFAGPPVIYMPQTVTRVLLPGATPYPSNIMSPPANYVYASAPFLRTDIYTSLPYGTFYWPQGYAGTTPVEPQVPAYVTAPASAILSTEADYSAGRYVPGIANEETLNPITAGINSNLVGSTTLSTEAGGTAASVVTAPQVDAVPSLTIAQPGPEAAPSAVASVEPPAPVNPFPVLSDTTAVSATAAAAENAPLAPLPSLPVLPAVPAVPTPAVPVPTPALPPAIAPTVPGLPELPAQVSQQTVTTSVTTLPSLPAAPPTQVSAAGLPTLPATAATPASMMPSLPQTSAAPATQIVVDDKTPGGLTTVPPEGWMPSASTENYGDSSLIANVEPGVVKTATFNATIPSDGLYKVELAYVGAPQFRSNAVPVTINTATGPQQLTVDQTQAGQWHDLGTYQLKAGQNTPVVTLSTAGLDGAGSNVSVSADAVRLTPVS